MLDDWTLVVGLQWHFSFLSSEFRQGEEDVGSANLVGFSLKMQKCEYDWMVFYKLLGTGNSSGIYLLLVRFVIVVGTIEHQINHDSATGFEIFCTLPAACFFLLLLVITSTHACISEPPRFFNGHSMLILVADVAAARSRLALLDDDEDDVL